MVVVEQPQVNFNPDETDEHHKYGQVNILFQEESVDKEKH